MITQYRMNTCRRCFRLLHRFISHDTRQLASQRNVVGRFWQRAKFRPLLFSSIAGIFTSLNQASSSDSDKNEGQSNLEVPNGDTLTTKYLIRNATMVSVESATTLLSYATSTLCSLEEEYTKGLYVLIKLMEVKLEYLGQPEQEKIENLIMETRHTVNTTKTKLKDMELLYHTSRKLVMAAGEAACLAGAEFATTVTNNTLNAAEVHISPQQQTRVKAELEYAETEAKTIEAESKHAEKEEKKRKQREESMSEQTASATENDKSYESKTDNSEDQQSGKDDNSAVIDLFNLPDKEYFKEEPSMKD